MKIETIDVVDDPSHLVGQLGDPGRSITMIGHETFGSGPRVVVVLNDWLSDTSTWDAARPYLDRGRFTWAFVDLRGYGRSKAQPGEHTVEEAAADVIALADAMGWGSVATVGHSMSTLVALHLAQQRPERIDRVVLVTPPPPNGFGADAAALEGMRALARGDDEARMANLRRRGGGRLSEGWLKSKIERWRATADPEAVADYAAMFAVRGLPGGVRVACPVLAVTGEQDLEPMRRAAVSKLLAPICAQLDVVALVESGHYPMQEAPPLLVATIERFLSQ